MNYNNKHFIISGREYENQFNEYKKENVDEKEKFMNQKLSQLPIHQLSKRTKLVNYYGTMMLIVYILLLCGMKILFIQGLRPVMLLQEMRMTNS